MPVFDGVALTVTHDAPTVGVLNVNVQDDLYEAWKNYQLADPKNRGFPPAFRTTGGDPLTPGVESGAYFFLNNVAGWRIISTDEDQTINYAGNLVGEDSSLPLVIPTPGRTVLHLGLQPVTQRVDELLLQGQEAQYFGSVTIDTINGVPGTAFPVGTPGDPVDNITDARAIADANGFRSYRFRNPLTLNANHINWNFQGIGALITDLLDVAGFSIGGSRVLGCALTGDLDGKVIDATGVNLIDCFNVRGIFLECGIATDISLAAGSEPLFRGTVSGTTIPEIDCAGATAVQFRNWSGSIRLANVDTVGFQGEIDLDPGSITLESSCTEGNIIIRGVGTLLDNSNGTTVISPGLLDTIEINDIHGQVKRSIYIDTSAPTNGNGFQQTPYNNLSDAADDAIAKGLRSFVVLGGAITLDRTFLNYDFVGVGNPPINLNGQITDQTNFTLCRLTGTSGGGAVESVLCTFATGVSLEGLIKDGALEGVVNVPNGGTLGLFDCAPVDATTTPEVALGTGGSDVSIRSYRGNLTVSGIADIADAVDIDMLHGDVTFAASCTNGLIKLSGQAQLIDNSAGSILNRLSFVDTVEQQEVHGQIRRSIFIDTSAVTNGNGYQQSPYNNFTDAVDDAEANGITSLTLLDDAVVDRQLRNFEFQGIGNPAIDFNGQDVNRSTFRNVELDGALVAANGITALACTLRNGSSGYTGRFFQCGFDGAFTLANTADATFIDCYSSIGGLSRPTITLGTGASNVSIRGYRGGLTLFNVDDVADAVTVEMTQGKLTLDATCTNGNISVRGVCQFTNSSAGSTVDTTGLLETVAQRLTQEIAESDEVFDNTGKVLHYYRRGTTDDLIPPKDVVTAIDQDTSVVQP